MDISAQHSPDADVTREYEIGFLVRSEEGIKELKSALLTHGGSIISEASPRRIALSYPIQKETSADFCAFRFSMTSGSVNAMRDSLTRSTHILRFLIVKPPHKRKPQFSDHEIQKQDMPRKPAPPLSVASLSNEALEKRIEEILQ